MSTVALRSIAWNKCFSFGENNKIDLYKEPVTQIIGPNGFGKSSIPLILEEALYNKNSKGVKKSDIANRLLDSNYDIDVEFSIDNDLFKVYVVRKGASVKVQLKRNGTDISHHTATATFKEIEELIGLDFKTFQQLVYQSTNSSLAFLTATDTARKKFLIDLFDLSEYTRLFELFKEEAKSVTLEASMLEGKLSTIDKWMQANSSLTTEYIPISEVPERPDFSNEIGDISGKISNAESTNARILKNNSILKKLESIPVEHLTDQIGEEQDFSDLQQELGQVQADKASADAVVKKLSGLRDKCHTCLQDIDKSFYDSLLSENITKSEEMAKRVKDIETTITSIKQTNALIQKAKSELASYEILQSQIDTSVGTEFIDSTELENQLAELRLTLTRVDKDIARVTAANNEAIRHNSKVDTYLEQNEEFTTQLIVVKEELSILQNKLKNLEVLKKAFSTNGLIAYKLENLVKDLEVYTNEYLAELSDGRFTIEFSISSDKLNVIVTDDGKEISISSPSSGEMARINIATLLAIRQLMSSISKNTINVLFLDEVISVLDDYGRERLVEILLKTEGLNSFLVSHSWTHPLVDKLEIKKDDGISWVDHG